MGIKNKRLDDAEFQQEREKVLAEWPTGKEVDLDEAVAFHKGLPETKNWPKRLQAAKERGETLLVTGMGHTTLEQQMELIRYAQDAGHADLLATSVDSLTRIHNYAGAQRGIDESLKTGQSVLNGFPIVNYGVAATRKLIQSVDVPVQMRFGASDPRLIEEIAFAGGHSANGADALHSFWNYTGKLSPETVLQNFQYVYRLYGYYEEHGVPTSVAIQGLYPSGAAPPSLSMAAALTEVLIAAEQGLKNIALVFHGQGNLVQDVGGARVLLKLGREYLDRFGYQDVETYLEFSLSLPRFPADPPLAFAMMCLNCLDARLCRAQVCVFRTTAEGKMICSNEELAESYQCGKTIINLVKDQKVELDNRAIEVEAKMAERETRAILERVLDLGEGDLAAGTLNAIRSGVLDNPFGTNPYVAGKVLGARDSEGAVRYMECGNLPFANDIVEFHREKIAARAKKLGHELDYDTIANDISAISAGFFLSYRD